MNYLKIGGLIGFLIFSGNLVLLLNKYYLNTYQYEKDYCLVSKTKNGCFIYSLVKPENLCLTFYKEPRDCNSYEDNQIIECWRFEWEFQSPKCLLYFFELDVKDDIKKIEKVFFSNFEKNIFNVGICLIVLNIYWMFKKKEPKVCLYVSEKSIKNNKMFEFNGKYYQLKRKLKTH